MKLALCLSLLAATPAFATDLSLPPTPEKVSLQAVVYDLLQSMHAQNAGTVTEDQNGRTTTYTLGNGLASIACQSDDQFSCTVTNEENLAAKSTEESSIQAILFRGLDALSLAQQQKRDHKQPLGPTLPVDRFESFTESGRYLIDGKFSLGCYKMANPESYYCEVLAVPPPRQTPNGSL